ncbi:MAG: hypothetical protein ACOYN6_12410 [Ignavibacteria bacterium]
MKIISSIGVKLFVLVIIATLFLASQFKSPTANEKNLSNASTTYPVPDSQFIIGAFDNARDLNYLYQDSFKFNTWHQYTAPVGSGWKYYANDRYDTTTSLYETHIRNIIDYNNDQKGMRTFMDRPIIEYLVGGQRIDYQCEYIAPNFQADPYWFWAYHTSLNNNTTVYDTIDNSRYGTGETVKRCLRTEQTAQNGYVAIDSGLRANRELSFIQTNDWMKDNAYEWYIMPKIRIDSAFASNLSNDTVIVCKFVLRGWKGNIVKEIPLIVKNFKNNYNLYDGSYKEMYNYITGQTKLEIRKGEIDSCFVNPAGNPFDWDNEINKTDIEVYWSGKCDMWIDRVRIENRPAHQYLTLKEGWLYEKMNKEIEWSRQNYNSQNPIPNYFYFEECQMSHFPMISALNKQIMDSTGNKNELVVWLNYDLFKAHVPNCWQYQFSADMLKTYLYNDFGIKTLVMGAYSLEGFELPDVNRSSYHPNSLSTASYNKYSGVLSYPASPGEYDNWLQDNTDNKIGGTGLIYIDKRIDELSRKGFKIIDCVQAHGWHSVSHKLKEPTNQELEFQACLALSYNAKGIIYFSYTSTRENDTVYGLCITNYPDLSLRTNVYGQSKLEGISSLNTKLIKWGPQRGKRLVYIEIKQKEVTF